MQVPSALHSASWELGLWEPARNADVLGAVAAVGNTISEESASFTSSLEMLAGKPDKLQADGTLGSSQLCGAAQRRLEIQLGAQDGGLSRVEVGGSPGADDVAQGWWSGHAQ